GDRPQIASPAHAVAAGKSEQQAQIVNLQQVRQLLRIGAAEQLLKILEENLARYVMAVALLLQRLPRPVAEHWQAQVQNRFVQKRDHRENGELDVLGRVAAAARFVVGQFYGAPDLRAERRGIAHLLAVGPQTLAHRQ